MSQSQTPMEAFFENQICLVVEPSKAFLASILSCIKSLNLPNTQVLSTSQYDTARQIIAEQKPKILISEYDVEGYNGLALVEMQQKHYDDQSRISMIISKNSSDSVVAEAAEEQVDAFLLKPFSPENFKKKLNDVIKEKVNPSSYVVKIREGLKQMHIQDFENAIEAFKEAKALNTKPALACYYLGETFHQQKNNELALQEFQEGRRILPLHYKCLTAEFEILVENRDYKSAYELIPILMKNFPLTPRRLTQVFIAAVYSLRFEYLSEYYNQFVKLDKKSPELIKVASAALFAGGKWYLQKKDLGPATVLFEKALLTVNKEISLLGRIVNELLKADAKNEAQQIFSLALPSDVGTPEYNRIAFRIDEITLNQAEFSEKARKFFLSGEADEENYETIVKLFAEGNRLQLAEATIAKATATYPDMRERLYKILEKHTPKK